MDIFNKKRVAELEKKLNEAECSSHKYMMMANEFENKLNAVKELTETIPEDCVYGSWCKACEFANEIQVAQYGTYGVYSVDTIYVCGKGKSCNHFVQKKVEENKKK